MKKTLTVVIALVLVVVMSVAGTVAYLTATTDPVVNTFTVGNIDITLAESKNLNLKMVPGNDITKDPKVTVVGGSEACWLFVKVEKSANLDSFVTYNIAEGWTALTGVDGVFYREVAASESNQEFAVLKDNKVTVKDTVTKAMMDALNVEGATKPTLTFTAYAVQKDNIADPVTAWNQFGS